MKSIINMKETGHKIYALREENGISVKKLSSELNLDSPQAIYNWQNGKRVPSLENVLKMSLLFGVKVDDIIQLNKNTKEAG